MQTVIASESHSNGISRMALALIALFARPDFTTPGSVSKIWSKQIVERLPSLQVHLLHPASRAASSLIAFFHSPRGELSDGPQRLVPFDHGVDVDRVGLGFILLIDTLAPRIDPSPAM